MAEERTSGEIVPFVAEQSDEYEGSVWLAGLAGAMLALLVISALSFFFDVWIPLGATGVAVIAAAAAALFAMIAALSLRIRLLLAGRPTIEARTAHAALVAFVREEVFATAARTGILLFVSLAERRAIVLGDTGINAHVRPDQWQDVVKLVVDGVGDGHAGEGFAAGISRCADILVNAGYAVATDDRNELPNRLRF